MKPLQTPKQRQAPSLSMRRIGVALLIGLGLLALLMTQFDVLREYKLYLTEDRKDVAFQLTELSEAWTERTLRERFAGLPMRCYPNPGEGLGDQGCIVDTKSYNGIPAMFISFFFSSGHLNQVSINVPWWNHRVAFERLRVSLGAPTASQLFPHSGIRLHGWQLPSGAVVLYNRDRSINPLQWNAIYWRSAAACREQPCFNRIAE
jgi:hypothetical protein